MIVAALASWLLAADSDLVLRARLDPFVTIVAGGASVGVDIARRQDPLRLSVAAFVVDVPRVVVPLISSGTTSLQIVESCVQLGVLAALSPEHRGFFLGPELYAYQLRYVDDAAPAHHAVAYEIYAHITAGYVWFLFSSGPGDHDNGIIDDVFVMPWLTAGAPLLKSGGAIFPDGVVVSDRVFNAHATVSIGLQL